jgi:hypothetical protein
LIVILILIVLIPIHAGAQVIATIPDTTAMPDSTVHIPIKIDLRNYGIISYYFEITFDPAVVVIESVTTDGTLSENWSSPVLNTNFPGTIIIGAFSIGDTVRGEGNLLNLVCKVTGSDGDSSLIGFESGYLNNGFPSVYKRGGMFKVKQTTSVRGVDLNALPQEVVLMPNYPDPFVSNTTISYRLDRIQHVSVRVFDILGRQVATLVDGIQNPQMHTFNWNGMDRNGYPLPNGVYFCVFVTSTSQFVERMTILR